MKKQNRDSGLRELAMEISLHSLGSSQTLPLPHLSTLAASRFCSFSDTIFPLSRNVEGKHRLTLGFGMKQYLSGTLDYVCIMDRFPWS